MYSALKRISFQWQSRLGHRYVPPKLAAFSKLDNQHLSKGLHNFWHVSSQWPAFCLFFVRFGSYNDLVCFCCASRDKTFSPRAWQFPVEGLFLLAFASSRVKTKCHVIHFIAIWLCYCGHHCSCTWNCHFDYHHNCNSHCDPRSPPWSELAWQPS